MDVRRGVMPPDVVVAKRLEQCRFLVGHDRNPHIE
jgi:hypothetical protein